MKKERSEFVKFNESLSPFCTYLFLSAYNLRTKKEFSLCPCGYVVCSIPTLVCVCTEK